MTVFKSGSIDANGIKIQYHRSGGERPVVLFLHGITEHGQAWIRFATYLEPFYDIVLMDLRGHGLSDKPEFGYKAEQMAEDVYWLIKKLDLVQPVIIGHSMGASVATAYAAIYKDMVSGLVLEDPPWTDITKSFEDKTAMANNYLALLSDFKEYSLSESLEKARQIYPKWDEVEYLPWAKGIQMVSPNSAQWILEVQTSYQEWITRLKIPGLLMTAEPKNGGLVIQAVAQKAQSLWKDLAVEHFPDTGHHIHREEYVKYRDLVVSFLRKIHSLKP